MIKYLATKSEDTITPIEIDRENNDYVIIGDHVTTKQTTTYGYFDTWDDAHCFLVAKSRSRLADLRAELIKEQSRLSRLQAMQP